MLHPHNNRAIISAINDRVIPDIQSFKGSLSTGHPDTESETSGNGQANSEQTNGLKTKITKKDSRSAFDLRHTGPKSLQQHGNFEHENFSKQLPKS